MEREEIRKRMRHTIAQLKPKCNDARYFDLAMDRILSLKGQLDIEPTISYIKVSDVLRTYQDSRNVVTFTETKNQIIVSVNGLKIIISPWLESLYGHTHHVIDLLEKIDHEGDTMSAEEKEEAEITINATIFIFTNILTCFSSVDSWLDTATYCAKTQRERNEKILKEAEEEDNLPDDNEAETEEYRKTVEAAEAIKKNAEENTPEMPV